MSWRRFGNLVRHLPRESATAVAQHGIDVYWGLSEQLLAAAVDSLNLALWQRSGGKMNTQPKPIPRPGVAKPAEKVGTESLSVADFEQVYARAQQRLAEAG